MTSVEVRMATVVNNNNDEEDTSESVDHMTTFDKYLRSIDVSAKIGKICRPDRTIPRMARQSNLPTSSCLTDLFNR